MHLKRFLSTRPRWRSLLAAVALGGLVAAGQAPVGLWYVALPALGLILWRAAAAPGWTAFAAGFGYALAGMFWIVEPFMVEPDVYGWMAPFALVFMAAGMGAFWAAGAQGARLGRGRAARIGGVAVGLVAMDAFRSHAFTGFPWILFGHLWIGTPVAQAAAWIGPIGLSLVTLLLAALPAMLPLRRGLPLALAVLAALWGAGSLRLSAPEPPRAAPVNVRIVQPNAEQALKWDPRYSLEFFYRHLDLTAEAPAPGKPAPDVVLWPETAVPFLLNDPGDGLRMASDAAGGVPVAIGIQRSEGARYYNSLAMIGAGGTVSHVYDKVHLVPFGEYMPFGDTLARIGISAFAAQHGNGYSAGQREEVLDLGPLGKAQPLICYESIFPQDVGRVAQRPDWIMLVTNDAWFGQLSGPWQHLAQAQLLAIEYGLPVARAANTGVSAMIDAYGRISAHLGMGEMGVIDAALPASLPPTPYSRSGDWPSVAATVLLGLIILALRRNNRVDPMVRRV